MATKFKQPVSVQYTHNASKNKTFCMIDNYIYLYHTDTLIAIPTYPESIADTMSVAFNPTSPLSSSAPVFTFQNSGPRSFQVELSFHRDMFNQINLESSRLKVPDLEEEDYVDIMLRQLQSMAVPAYMISDKMVNPPLVAVRFGNDIFCKGVINGSVSVTYSGPILRTDKYALVAVSFTMNEVDPYDAKSIATLGSYRGLTSFVADRVKR